MFITCSFLCFYTHLRINREIDFGGGLILCYLNFWTSVRLCRRLTLALNITASSRKTEPRGVHVPLSPLVPQRGQWLRVLRTTGLSPWCAEHHFAHLTGKAMGHDGDTQGLWRQTQSWLGSTLWPKASYTVSLCLIALICNAEINTSYLKGLW